MKESTADRVIFGVLASLFVCVVGFGIYDYNKSSSKELVNPYQTILDATVKVYSGSGHGSGVLIKENVVITNRHVVEQINETDVEFNDGTKMRAEVVLQSKGGLDIAVLRLFKHSAVTPISVACRIPIVGEDISIVGNPLKTNNVLLKGIISSNELPTTEDSPENDKYTIMQAPVNSGNSGGGTFDKHGNLLGITTAYLVASSGMWVATNSGLALMQPAYKFCDVLGLE